VTGPLTVPLVEPGAELTAEELSRYARHLTLDQVGMTGQRRLKNARVLVIGAGGLGSPALQYLAAAGVGTLGIVDDDVVEVTNLQRQVVHGVDSLGAPKVDSAAAAVARINPSGDGRTPCRAAGRRQRHSGSSATTTSSSTGPTTSPRATSSPTPAR
jgi:molybdopterin/thiamine biosynthesis adenylyltransferase